MIRKRTESALTEKYIMDSTGKAISAGITQEELIAEIDIDDKNEVKKKIEKFVGLKPEVVAQLLKTWLSEE